MFGNFAQFYLDNNMACRITKEEALKVLNLAEENGLVLSPSNTRHLEAICCCCTCCCPFVKGLKRVPSPAEIVQNNYWSTIDKGLCTGGEECIEVCPPETFADTLSRIAIERGVQ